MAKNPVAETRAIPRVGAIGTGGTTVLVGMTGVALRVVRYRRRGDERLRAARRGARARHRGPGRGIYRLLVGARWLLPAGELGHRLLHCLALDARPEQHAARRGVGQAD